MVCLWFFMFFNMVFVVFLEEIFIGILKLFLLVSGVFMNFGEIV